MKNLLILLCVGIPMLVVAEVYSDPYGYWYTDLTEQERYELDVLLNKYYSYYLNEPPKPAKTSAKRLDDEYCSNYLKEFQLNP